MTISNISLLASATCVGLMAGLFYAYSCSVTPGLAKLPDEQYIFAMQSINRAIQNPVFFISFFGALVLLPLSAYLKFEHPASSGFWLLFSATVIYIAGSFGVTVFGNIPLNNSLENFNFDTASKELISLQRAGFEAKWNILNIIRTVSAIISFILTIIACINIGHGSQTTLR